MSFSRAGAVYVNPQGQAFSYERAGVDSMLAALTPSERAYVKREHAANALRFGENARWVINHPGLVALVLASVASAQPEVPFAGLGADIFSLGAAGKDVTHHDRLGAALDVSAAGFGRSAAIELRLAARDERAASQASRRLRRVQDEISANPSGSTPDPLIAERKKAIDQFRTARFDEASHRRSAAFKLQLDAFFARAGAAWTSDGNGGSVGR